MTEGAGPYPVAIEVEEPVEARAARRTGADVMPSFEASYFQRRLSPR